METPISLLHLICIQNNTKADYTLLSREGQIHLPTFTFRVQVNQYIEEASGQSKKKAKHLAAKKMLLRLLDDQNIMIKEDRNIIIENLKNVDDFFDQIENKRNIELMNKLSIDSTSSQQNHSDNNKQQQQSSLITSSSSSLSYNVELENPIGKLQEICMKKHWHPPVYSEAQSTGLPHERLFTFECKIENMNIVVYGQGKSKKSAKREAAEKMLEVLRMENLDKIDEILDRIPKNSTTKNNFNNNNNNSENVFNLCTEIIAFQKNREKNKNTNIGMNEMNIQKFYKNLIKNNKNILEEIRQLIPKELNEFIQKYFYDNIIDDLDNLLNNLLKLINCHINCVLHPEKSQTDEYQYWAELITNDCTTILPNNNNNNNNNLMILSVWGIDSDLFVAKQKALSRLFLTFILFCYY